MRRYTVDMPRAKSNPQVALKPQDLLVLLRLSLAAEEVPSYAGMGAELGLSASEVHACVERALLARLVRKDPKQRAMVILDALRPFVLHGAPYCFPAIRGGRTRGVPTGYAAAPLNAHIVAGQEPVPVWPHKDGTVRGETLHPLCPSAPEAAMRNPALYELLALFDALRGGSMRERALAAQMLTERLTA